MTLFSSESRRGSSRASLYLGGALLVWNLLQVAGQNCPVNSIDHCDDPSTADAIWNLDPTVECSRETCEWQTQLFSPTTKPIHCRNLDIIRASDPVTDFLEPCLLWELIYGEFAPTSAPTLSMQPTISKQPSPTPTGTPSVLPTQTPTSMPSSSPSK